MRINSVEMKNIRSYQDDRIELDNGLILLYGDNGAGKSSLLSSIFSGLYMSDVLKFMGDDINLDSLVRRGKSNGTINLEFGINGDIYEVNWNISVTEDKNGERQASTSKCVLTGGDIDEPVEGVRAVKSSIEDIMGLGPESFVNSVYVQQGDITRMVNADETKRKEIIDGLLGLSKLDDYIDRMDEARLEFGAQKRTVDKMLTDKQRQLDDLSDEKEIQERLQSLKDKKSTIQDQKDKVDKGLEKYQKKIIELQQKIDQYKETEDSLKDIRNEVEEKKDRRDDLESKKQAKKKEIKTIETEMEQVDENIRQQREDLDLSNKDVDEIREVLDELNSELNDIRDSITRISEGKIETINNNISRNESEIKQKKKEIEEHERDIENLKSDINQKERKKESIEEDISNIQDRIKEVEEEIIGRADRLDLEFDEFDELRQNVLSDEREKQIEKIVDASKDLGGDVREKSIYKEFIDTHSCPICSNDHSEPPENVHNELEEIQSKVEEKSNKVDSIWNQEDEIDMIDGLLDELKQINSDLNIKKSNKSQVQDQIKNKKQNLSEQKSEKDTKKDQVKEIKDKNENLRSNKEGLSNELENLRQKKKNVESRKQDIKSLVSDIEQKNEIQNLIDDLQNDVEKFEELRQSAQKQYLEKKKKMKELEDEIEDINVSESRERKKEYSKKKSEFENKKDKFESQISKLQEKIASKNQELKRVRDLEDRVNQLESKKVEAKEEERNAESVIKSYNDVKSTLREENIGLLNKYANDIFNSVYDNKVYQKMKISKEYDITLVTGDGIEVDPKDLSGGEKTIVSLAIRAGVYKLLVERQGSADTLPPFILDEPTTYLDDSHVSNLQDVIETITSWDVPQVIVVSHREDMIQNADSGYEVQKDPATETSRVSKRY